MAGHVFIRESTVGPYTRIPIVNRLSIVPFPFFLTKKGNTRTTEMDCGVGSGLITILVDSSYSHFRSSSSSSSFRPRVAITGQCIIPP